MVGPCIAPHAADPCAALHSLTQLQLESVWCDDTVLSHDLSVLSRPFLATTIVRVALLVIRRAVSALLATNIRQAYSPLLSWCAKSNTQTLNVRYLYSDFNY
jgi:hypothetical protein